MASEDSEEVGPGFLTVHRLRDLHDVRQPLKSEVMASIGQFDALREFLEVALLRRIHRVHSEERNDLRDQIRPPARRTT